MVYALEDVLLCGAFLQLPHGDEELPDEAVAAALVVVVALHSEVAVLE